MADREFKIQQVGSDSELFLTNSEGESVPVCGLVGGTKEEPIPVLDKPGFAVQEDNVMLEFNIPPASSAKEFSQDMSRMLDYLKERMKEKNLTLNPESLAQFKELSLIEHPQAMVFGCQPDLCVWTRSINEPTSHEMMSFPTLNGVVSYRVAGAHVHVSFTCAGEESSLVEKELMVKALDCYVGLPLTIISSMKDRDRRKFYGRAGAFRIKPYGIEYRVLGGSILSTGSSTYEYMFNQVKEAEAFLNNNRYSDLCTFFDGNQEVIQRSINGGRANGALDFCTRQGIKLPPNIDEARLKQSYEKEKWLATLLESSAPVAFNTTATTAIQAG